MAEGIGVAPEFAIADGIVRLTNERQELTTARQFEIPVAPRSSGQKTRKR